MADNKQFTNEWQTYWDELVQANPEMANKTAYKNYLLKVMDDGFRPSDIDDKSGLIKKSATVKRGALLGLDPGALSAFAVNKVTGNDKSDLQQSALAEIAKGEKRPLSHRVSRFADTAATGIPLLVGLAKGLTEKAGGEAARKTVGKTSANRIASAGTNKELTNKIVSEVANEAVDKSVGDIKDVGKTLFATGGIGKAFDGTRIAQKEAKDTIKAAKEIGKRQTSNDPFVKGVRNIADKINPDDLKTATDIDLEAMAFNQAANSSPANIKKDKTLSKKGQAVFDLWMDSLKRRRALVNTGYIDNTYALGKGLEAGTIAGSTQLTRKDIAEAMRQLNPTGRDSISKRNSKKWSSFNPETEEGAFSKFMRLLDDYTLDLNKKNNPDEYNMNNVNLLLEKLNEQTNFEDPRQLALKSDAEKINLIRSIQKGKFKKDGKTLTNELASVYNELFGE